MLAFCQECGHIFYDQVITNDQVNAYYSDKVYDPSNVSTGSGSQNKDDIEHQKDIIKRISEYFELTQNGPTLDVGAGRGGLTKRLTESGYKNVIAIEPSEDTVEIIRGQDLTAYVGSAQNLPKLSSPPALAIYSHILEHILEPTDALREIKKIIKPQGIVYIEVPNASSYPQKGLPYNSLYLEHLNHFTKSSLKNLLTISGFEILKIEEGTLNLSSKNGLYESVIYVIARPKSVEGGTSHHNLSSSKKPKLNKTTLQAELDGFVSYLNWSKNHRAFEKIQKLANSKKPTWLWGISQLTQLLLGQKPLSDVNIYGFCDLDKSKQRHTLMGKSILSPSSLKTLKDNDTVLLMVHGAENEMKAYLSDIGFRGEVLTLMNN
jgi:2-polyprenyl-3-methyl-5-hydroxy-6-metoxy-1,4-benzoquinol methylase